jgi:heme exporter protein D
MMEFLAMGGHGGYVWSAYAITLIVLTINGWAARRRHLSALAQARRTSGAELPEARRAKVKTL